MQKSTETAPAAYESQKGTVDAPGRGVALVCLCSAWAPGSWTPAAEYSGNRRYSQQQFVVGVAWRGRLGARHPIGLGCGGVGV